MIDEIIKRILAMPEVDDIYRKEEIKLQDGRILISLNIYLKSKPADSPSLNVRVRDGVQADDIFGGV